MHAGRDGFVLVISFVLQGPLYRVLLTWQVNSGQAVGQANKLSAIELHYRVILSSTLSFDQSSAMLLCILQARMMCRKGRMSDSCVLPCIIARMQGRMVDGAT